MNEEYKAFIESFMRREEVPFVDEATGEKLMAKKIDFSSFEKVFVDLWKNGKMAIDLQDNIKGLAHKMNDHFCDLKPEERIGRLIALYLGAVFFEHMYKKEKAKCDTVIAKSTGETKP